MHTPKYRPNYWLRDVEAFDTLVTVALGAMFTLVMLGLGYLVMGL